MRFSLLVVASIPKTNRFQLYQDFIITCSKGIFTVPEGFVTDFASVPQVLQLLIKTDAPYIREASVLHDYLYDKQCAYDITQNAADALLIEGMNVLGANAFQCTAVWQALAMFGKRHFRR